MGIDRVCCDHIAVRERDDDIRLVPDQVLGKRRQLLWSVREAAVDDDVLSFDEACIPQAIRHSRRRNWQAR